MNIIEYLGEVKSEMQKVVWPTRRDTIMYTVVVIAFSVGVAAILGLADYGLLQLFAKILNRS
ncbi:MAG TPA: preprotein translocase subunit SecE [Patescibacteria group bacterium]|nr:preprotein translocase subunit SecE [Patescibacteria group bacterium]